MTGSTAVHLLVTDTLIKGRDVDQNQSVSGVTICLMQRNTSPSHRVNQAVDCSLCITACGQLHRPHPQDSTEGGAVCPTLHPGAHRLPSKTSTTACSTHNYSEGEVSTGASKLGPRLKNSFYLKAIRLNSYHYPVTQPSTFRGCRPIYIDMEHWSL